jgi:hypothetical protein
MHSSAYIHAGHQRDGQDLQRQRDQGDSDMHPRACPPRTLRGHQHHTEVRSWMYLSVSVFVFVFVFVYVSLPSLSVNRMQKSAE